MTDLGNIVTGIVTDKDQSFSYVQKNGHTYRLVSKDPVEIGDTVEAFAYVDKKDKRVMSTKIPKIANGNYTWGVVVEVRKDLGVFVDVGLEEKDIVVSIDDLPEIKQVWPKKGDKLLIAIRVDNKDRLWGKLADEKYAFTQIHSGKKALQNNNVSGYVIEGRRSGSLVYLEDNYLGFIHPDEREEEPRLGQFVVGRVVGLREDGVLYVSLKPRNHEALDDDAQMILEIIKRNQDHYIPYHDKSAPEAIKQYFGISKAQFKRAVGRLMKNGLVYQNEEGTHLKK